MKKSFLYSLFAILCFCVASCSTKSTGENEKVEEQGSAMPRTLYWVFSGEQMKDGTSVFTMSIRFHEGIYGQMRYGTDLSSDKFFEKRDIMWKMVDGIVSVYSYVTKELLLTGKILDKDHLDVSFEQSLGQLWDSEADKCGWESHINLSLTEISDMELYNQNPDYALWYPWSIPGYDGKLE